MPETDLEIRIQSSESGRSRAALDLMTYSLEGIDGVEIGRLARQPWFAGEADAAMLLRIQNSTPALIRKIADAILKTTAKASVDLEIRRNAMRILLPSEGPARHGDAFLSAFEKLLSGDYDDGSSRSIVIGGGDINPVKAWPRKR